MNIKVIRGTSASECNHIFISEELRVKVMFVVQVKELTAELLMPQLKIWTQTSLILATKKRINI